MQPPADIAPHLQALQRTIRSEVRDGREAQVVAVERPIDARIEQVWVALTDAERIRQWFLPVEGRLEEGGNYATQGNAHGDIVRCDAPRGFELTWVFGDDCSWLNVTLTTDGDATRVRIEHTSHLTETFAKTYGPGATGVGWDLALMCLAENLAGAPPIDHDVAPLWPTTEQGKAFVAESSQGWVQAEIAAGTDPARAKAAGHRTFGFYTGEGGDSSGASS